ncbi:hypothetical protein QFC22_006693 [Naganishia vaughanmartiniae]|uniref:Uncharacterized protein n=1 Tax=Naganishia vaughanmartiniae TaxID=1424756 RepID=A0ACC2WHR7_9TREE|nr:hypothetical protein QFC22_006693 [Naganishia vaughanmartiniae]
MLLESVKAYATDARNGLRNALYSATDLIASTASTKSQAVRQTAIASHCTTHTIILQQPSIAGSTYSTDIFSALAHNSTVTAAYVIAPYHSQCGRHATPCHPPVTPCLAPPPSGSSSPASKCCGMHVDKDVVVISDDSGEEEERKPNVPSGRTIGRGSRGAGTKRASSSQSARSSLPGPSVTPIRSTQATEVDELEHSSSSDSETELLSSQLGRPPFSTPSANNEVTNRPVWDASSTPAQMPGKRRAKTVLAPKQSSQSRPDSPPRTEVYYCGACPERRLENVAAVILHLEQVHQSQFDNGADIVCTTCAKRQPMGKLGFIRHIRLHGCHINPPSPGQSFKFVLRYQPINITGGSSSPSDATIRESTDPSSGSSSPRLPSTPSASEKKRRRLNLEGASSGPPRKSKTRKDSKGKGKAPATQ